MLENEPLPAELLTSLDKDFSGWRNWPEDQKKKLLEKLLYDFDLWRLPQQAIPPDNEWRYYVNLSGRGGSKRLDIETPILTPAGFKKMSEIQVGDIVFDEQGNPTNVVHTSEIEYTDTYKVTFSDKSFLYADGGHQWVTHTKSDRSKWDGTSKFIGDDKPYSINWASKNTPVTTLEIKNTITYPGSSQWNKSNHSIPLCEPINFPEVEVPIHPYVLGCWLGDGYSAGATICGVDQEIFQNLRDCGVLLNRHNNTATTDCQYYGMKFLDRSLKTDLRTLNLINNKHIPEIYLLSSYEQRLDLLKGLMDTDGNVNRGWRCVSFSNSNKTVIDDVYRLICSLGLKPTIQEKKKRDH